MESFGQLYTVSIEIFSCAFSDSNVDNSVQSNSRILFKLPGSESFVRTEQPVSSRFFKLLGSENSVREGQSYRVRLFISGGSVRDVTGRLPTLKSFSSSTASWIVRVFRFGKYSLSMSTELQPLGIKVA